MKKNKVILLILALVIASGIIFIRTRVKDLTEKAYEIDNILTEYLIEAGKEEEKISSAVKTEKEKDRMIWVELYRQIETTPERMDLVGRLLREVAGRSGYDVIDIHEEEKSQKIEVGLHGAVLSCIELTVVPERYKVAIIVDDLGQNSDIGRFLELGIDLTYAILPGLRKSTYYAEKFNEKNIPYILHMPMEPERYPEVNPGRPVLLNEMNETEMRSALKKAMEDVPGINGLNNHMGSSFTSNPESMSRFLKIAKDKNLFFIDSWTTGRTLGYEMARDYGVKTALNTLFLDNKDDLDYIKGRLRLIKKRVDPGETMVAICHAQRLNTVSALEKMIPELKIAGVEFVQVEEVLH